MNRYVLKWRVQVPEDPDAVVEVRLPVRTRILYVGCQSPFAVTIWTESESREPGPTHRYQVIGTGWSPLRGFNYIGTGVYGDPLRVWHLYEGPVASG